MIEIVVLTNSLVYVGEVVYHEDSLRIAPAWNIRRFGTTRGLGEIALNGPTRDTILDPSGPIKVFYESKSWIHSMECEQEPWIKKLLR